MIPPIQSHVHLVTENIAEITETGIRTTDGKDHPVDVIVYATGQDHEQKDHIMNTIVRVCYRSGPRTEVIIEWTSSSMLQIRTMDGKDHQGDIIVFAIDHDQERKGSSIGCHNLLYAGTYIFSHLFVVN